MAVSRRGFLLFGTQLNPYEAPKKGTVADVRFADEIAGEKSRPPVPVGAGSWKLFRAKCVGCLKCVPACPRGLIVPSSKLGHLGRPEIRFVKGWCRPECNRCAEACPAGAIKVKIICQGEDALTTKSGASNFSHDDANHCSQGEDALTTKSGASNCSHDDAKRCSQDNAKRCGQGVLALAEKGFHPNLAIWHPERCVAANGRDECHACERHCPVKAITLVEPSTGGTSVVPEGTDKSVRSPEKGTDKSVRSPFKVPRVEPAKCIGCGACEHYCPARPKAAMSVEGRA